MGEIQVVKTDLVADSKVNRVGNIVSEDIDLLDYIGPGQKYIIEKEKQDD
ncbi:MAG: phospho-sugar glycosidase domain-containing protein [Lactococcus raffinolactis]